MYYRFWVWEKEMEKRLIDLVTVGLAVGGVYRHEKRDQCHSEVQQKREDTYGS